MLTAALIAVLFVAGVAGCAYLLLSANPDGSILWLLARYLGLCVAVAVLIGLAATARH